VRIELSGGLRVHREGRVIARFPTHKAGALLGYLAFHRERTHPRESLTEIFWSDSTPTDSLRESSHRLVLRVLNTAGQPAAALQQFHELERLLKDKLNAAPSARTWELAREISQQLAVSSGQLEHLTKPPVILSGAKNLAV
jgi:DNA-binding SARP family transcriptional activator